MRYYSATIIALLLASACDSSDTTIDDIKQFPPDTIRYLMEDAPSNDPRKVEVTVTFGSDQSRESYMLSDAYIDGVGMDGTVFIRDLREKEIHRFSVKGEYLGKFGGQGSGPGEFNSLWPLMVIEDRVFTWDPRLQRLSIFSLQGNYQKSIQSPQYLSSQSFPLHNSSSNEYVIADHRLIGGSVRSATPTKSHFRIMKLDSTLNIIHTFFDTTVTREPVNIGPSLVFSKFAFDYVGPVIAVSSGLPIAWSYDDGYSINLLDPETGARRLIHIVDHRAPLIDEEWKSREMQNWVRLGYEEEARRKIVFNRFHRHISTMSWDDLGRLWVLDWPDDFEPEFYSYNVFSANGEWLSQQQIPVSAMLITSKGIYGVPLGKFLGSNLDYEEAPIFHFYSFKH